MTLLLLLALWDPTLSGSLPDPVLTAGCDAVSENPALIALEEGSPASFRFVGFGAGGSSDVVTLPLLWRVATRPVYLDAPAKQSLLDRMADGAGSLATGTDLRLVHCQWWRVGAALTLQDRAVFEVPRDVAELVLYGNHLGRTYRLDGLRQDTLQYVRATAAAGFPVYRSGPLVVHAGLSAAWLRGIRCAQTSSSSGWLLTTAQYASGRFDRLTVRSSGGDGFALGFGAVAELGGRWRAAVALADAPAVIWWTRGCTEKQYSVVLDSTSVMRVLQLGSLDSVLHSGDSVRPAVGFATGLPVRLTLGIGWAGSDVFRAALVGGAGGGFAGTESGAAFGACRLMLRVLRAGALGIDVGYRSGQGPFGQLSLGGRLRGLTSCVTVRATLDPSRPVTDASADLSIGYTY
jgi:hypothetical protein